MTRIIYIFLSWSLLSFSLTLPSNASDDAKSMVSKAIELTLQEGAWVDGAALNKTAKSWLKYKRKNKAIAFCTDWESQVPKVLAGAKYFELMGLGWHTGAFKEDKAIEGAIKWCKKIHKDSYGDYDCQCEHIWTNDEFVFSERLSAIINSSVPQKNEAAKEKTAESSSSSDTSRKAETDLSAQPTDSIKEQTRDKLGEAKSICSEIGLKAGTEEYGKCVMKMMDG